MKQFLLIICLGLPFLSFAQSNSIKGSVLDEKGAPLVYSTIALLNPADSTLSAYALSNSTGAFECKSSKAGSFLMQVSCLGYLTYTKPVQLPLENENIGSIVLQPEPINLEEIRVTAENIPIRIKKDTIEFNASSFKTGPDAVAADLLKKMPGIEVDRAGNIKAMGEDVKKVLVDGKEFFNDDPKMATRTLPADAIKKAQVYDKKSDESEFTGISDGSQEKVINLVLQDNKKNGLFGDLQAGAGSDERYQMNSKLFRFDKQNQYAAIGMINNVSQYGFSLYDYLSYNRGSIDLLKGGSMTLTSDLPINMGSTPFGDLTYAAGGLNFSHQKSKNSRFSLNYLADGSDKNLQESSFTRNYTASGSFVQNEDLNSTTKNRSHRLNLYWKNRMDSTQNIILNAGINLSTGNKKEKSFTESLTNDLKINELSQNAVNDSKTLTANLNASYIKKAAQAGNYFKCNLNASNSYKLNDVEWNNLIHYIEPDRLVPDNLTKNDHQNTFNSTAEMQYTFKTGDKYYLEPGMSFNVQSESLNRSYNSQTLPTIYQNPVFTVDKYSLQPEVTFRKTGNTMLALTLGCELMAATKNLNSQTAQTTNNYLYFLPSFIWKDSHRSGQHMLFRYQSSVHLPAISQLMPVADNSNPLMVFNGNINLKPEYRHDLYFSWFLFDQFSFTNLVTFLNASYTKNKVGFSRIINAELGQSLTAINVPDDYLVRGTVNFSTPIRKLGITFHTEINETWNKGLGYVNSVENVNTNFNHNIKITFDNRNKNKWDINVGGSIDFTDARYSFQSSLNNQYFNLSYFAEVRYIPNERWNFETTADVANYNSKSFNNSLTVPLIGAKVNYFTKNKRWTISLSGFDLLNKNNGIQRTSEMNYLAESHSNIIGRYVLLSLKYKINKLMGGDSKEKIMIKRM